MARRIGVPFEPVPYTSFPPVLAGAKSGEWDIAMIGIGSVMISCLSAMSASETGALSIENAMIEGNKVRVQFDHIGGGLKTRDGGELKHFQIAGQDQKWVWAQAKIENNEVIVSSDAVATPVGVRYAWAAWPEGANLINAEGLPASCFRTDEFIPSTLGVVSPFQEVQKAQAR